MIKLTYKQMGTFEFAQAIMKIESTPTTPVRANHIRHLTQPIKEATKNLQKAFKEKITDVYAERDEDMKAVRDDEGIAGFKCKDGMEEDLKKALDDYGSTVFEIDYRPLNNDTLADIKMTGKELEQFGELYSDGPGAGPGVPLHSV